MAIVLILLIPAVQNIFYFELSSPAKLLIAAGLGIATIIPAELLKLIKGEPFKNLTDRNK